MHGLIIREVGGQPVALRLTVGACFGVEEEVEGGIGDAMKRIQVGSFTLKEIRAVIKHLVVGGGMDPLDAHKLVAGLRLHDIEDIRRACLDASIASWANSKNTGTTSAAGSSSKFDRGDVYESAFSIGLKPAEVDALTVWEWERVIAGWNLAHGAPAGGGGGGVAKDEMAALIAKYG
ncbi:gene transfer agent family protein [Rhizobium sp. CFBP 13726]|uniref:gene transfer agent family protein n=1 Tax=Rhizobium sp. CFBP 13726 TaxID=2775296 RepID=UPI00201807FA|nr:gene transfer agent family protein [Rhizobium sp. CFBP 13726]